MTARRESFVAALGFDLDPFQLRAFDALDGGRSVLVAAPTGSGKTVVAEYAVDKALGEGQKAFYTTPLKALSNQKFADLTRRHGAERVGLLTGDNVINGEASVVVMTTEVLRNMIYAQSSTLEGLRYVVLDEVHYLQNPYRGAVWEEVIIHLPPEVDLVCLSATVSNAEEFADWIQTVRGATEAIIEERRPVELTNLYLAGDKAADRLHLLPTFVDGRPNPEAAALDARNHPRDLHRGRSRNRLYTPRRTEVAELLAEEDMLPAIYFIFSRAACDDAVRRCVQFGARLTTPEERKRIRAIAEAKVDVLSDADLAVLGYGEWLSGLEAGFAAHHAGMVPPFKEAVEACFAEALVKVVFATETLSLGINMPARSVVLEKLTKFDGERHVPLTPGEYTQFTGRAGRRGIDERGYAIVLWSPFVPFDQVAGLASRRTYALTSSFRPTYNMAANLVRRYQPATAHHLLNLSFAQFRADADIVRLERDLERLVEQRDEARSRAECERGDIDEYRRLRQDAESSGRMRPSARTEVQEALERVKPGDVLVLPGGKSGGRVAVLSTSRRRGGDVRVRALTVGRRVLSLAPRDFPAPPRAVARVELPTPYTPNNPGFQRQVAESLTKVRLREDGRVGVVTSRRRHRGEEAMVQAEEVASHPVSTCPDAERHLRAAARVEHLERQIGRKEREIRGRTESLARQFDRVLRVLEGWDYIEGWALTEAGEQLSLLYHECDLVIAECLRAGIFDELTPPEVAGLASVFTFESRGPAGQSVAAVGGRLRDRWGRIEAIAADVRKDEEDAGLPLTRLPDPGFVELARGWAAGDDLAALLGEEEISGGDFVRNVKQLIDLLRQLGSVATRGETAAAARTAADGLFRGVVAASSTVGT